MSQSVARSILSFANSMSRQGRLSEPGSWRPRIRSRAVCALLSLAFAVAAYGAFLQQSSQAFASVPLSVSSVLVASQLSARPYVHPEGCGGSGGTCH